MVEINGYELIEKIGEGGMATVWKARQLSLDRIVAIKILGKTSLPDQEARDRFRKEAQTTARLNHPGIVQVIDTGEMVDDAYLVMEFVDGLTVGDLIHQSGSLSESRALEIVESVARALMYAWEKECLIHCDIKPDNILIDRHTGVVKVADLGLARMISLRGNASDSDLIFGTPNYTAPEQSAGISDLDCRSDMYSLGATLYHMATGVMPFRDAAGSQAMTRHEVDYLDDPKEIKTDISVALAWLIEKLMVKNRAFRPHFWTQVVKDIEEVRRGHMPLAPLPDEGASTIRRGKNRSLVKHTEAKVAFNVPSGGPVKLTLKKSALPVRPVPVTSGRSAGKTAAVLLFMVLVAACVYGVLIYLGKVPPPPVPRFFAPGETSEPSFDDTVQSVAPPVIEPEQPTPESPDIWRNDDFIQGARLFNQALADYKTYQETRRNPGVLRDVESNCRDAISYFEACRGTAPEHINIGQYIDQCYGMIANVRHSTKLDDESRPAATGPKPERAEIQMTVEAPAPKNVVFVDDEPPPPVTTMPKIEENLLRISLGSGWENPVTGSDAFRQEFKRLMMRHAAPTRSLEVDANVVLYPGINCMMTAREAAKVLKQELPIRRPLKTPGFPSDALYGYQFAGDFSGAKELTLVVDLNDRVVMAQLYDNREVPARMETALFSTNWSVYDFIGAKKREETDGLIAHRVRKNNNLIRLDSELETTTGSRTVKARIALLMPVQMAGILLQAGTAVPAVRD
jgi:serine/threonine protein kinase